MGYSSIMIATVLVAAAVTGLLVWLVRRRPAAGSPAESGTGPRIVLVLAAIAAGLTIVGTVASVLQVVFAREVAVTVRVGGFIPPVDERVVDIDGPTAEAVGLSPGFTEAALNVVGLDAWARAWLATGHAVNGAVIVALLLLVAGLARRAARPDPFDRPLSGRLAAGGIALAAGSLVWQAAFGIGGSLASAQVFGAYSWAINGDVGSRYSDAGLADTGLPLPTFAFDIEFWPIGVGLALIVVAGLLRTAERLQRETAGLV